MNRRQFFIYWFGGWIFDFTKIVTLLAFLILIVHYFFYTVLIVKGDSMRPNYWDGDVLMIDRVAYRLNRPHRGDPISLYFPGEVEKKFMKRIIGLPGEAVTIKQNQVFINQKLLNEPYIKNIPTVPDMDIKLHDDEYFVLGDNRDVSSDSRIWGPLPKEYIIGATTERLGNLNDWKNSFLNLFH